MKLHEVKVGVPVTYYSVIFDNGKKLNPFLTQITSEAWQLGCGELVCKVKGKSGGVSLDHLELKEKPEYGLILSNKIKYCYSVNDDDWIEVNCIYMSDFNNDSLLALSFALASKFEGYVKTGLTLQKYHFKNLPNQEDIKVLNSAIAYEVLRRGYTDMAEFGKKTIGDCYGDFSTLQEFYEKQPLESWYE